MTVKELVEELSRFDGSMNVYLQDSGETQLEDHQPATHDTICVVDTEYDEPEERAVVVRSWPC